ncbi:MAG: S8 family serine peptidase [Verrucomicrobia bacterium]|nr:S8 family serine peptidase [Verrucomicrobiota bacterium]
MHKPYLLAVAGLAFALWTGHFSAAAETKKSVQKDSDLPAMAFPIAGSISDLLTADDHKFDAFANQVSGFVDTLLREYDIQDKATLTSVLSAQFALEILRQQNEAALKTLESVRALQEKPALKLTYGLFQEAILRARETTKSSSGAAFDQAVGQNYTQLLEKLPWDQVQDVIRSSNGTAPLLTQSFILGRLQEELQPQIDHSHSLDWKSAFGVLDARVALQEVVPINAIRIKALGTYVAAHDVLKPDIWESRNATLRADEGSPVVVGVWDSGVDSSLFANQLFQKSDPGEYSPNGLAFTNDGFPSNSNLRPLSDEDKAAFPDAAAAFEGISDLQASADTPAAKKLKQQLASESKEQVQAFFHRQETTGSYAHGTHVAGILLRGNPQARLAVFRFNDELSRGLDFVPTREYVERMADNFRRIGQYCDKEHVRVVNMSWGDDPAEFEEWLSRTKAGQSADERKKEALELFNIWKQGIADAIKAAPNTLFVTAAGNADSDSGFLQDVPSSLDLPNMIAVGATNQAGDPTSFTSYGKTVVVYANGYHVKSYVPGGIEVKLSGTSMASPQVANLAGKLFALDPSLTPEIVRQLVIDGATKSDDGKRLLMDEKRSIELLQERKKS